MLYKKTVNKSIKDTLLEIKKNAKDYGFIIREVFNMAQDFASHGVEVEKGFKYYSVMICNPQKAYESIRESAVRGAVLLPPKQVAVYSETEGETTIAYEAPDMERLEKIMPDDGKFQEGLYASGQKIIKLIDSV